MGFFEDLFGTSAGIASGGVIMGTGVLVTTLKDKVDDKNLKLLTQIGGLVMVGYGGMKVYQAVTNPTDKTNPNDAFSLVMVPPNNVKVTVGYPYKATVGNLNSTNKLFYVGCTLAHTDSPFEEFNMGIISMKLSPGEEKEITWWQTAPGSHAEPYSIRWSVWNVNPSGKIEGQTVFRVADTDWYPFIVKGFFDP